MAIGTSVGLAMGFVLVYGGDGEGGAADQVLKALRDGNASFVEASAKHPRADAARRGEVASGQHPSATIVACSDSRVSPERVFDQGLGDLFVVRVAGNVCDTDEIGSIEYGVGHLHTPMLLVLGHTKCGAVTAVARGDALGGHIRSLVDNIGPAVTSVKRAQPELSGDALVSAAVRANVLQSIQDVLARSDEVRKLAGDGKLRIEGAVYDVATGKVEWLGEHPQQAALLTGPVRPANASDGATAKEVPAPAALSGAESSPREAVAANESGPSAAGSEALAKLVSGNDRFARQRSGHPHCDLARRSETAGGQHPFATVLGCSDSRVPPELVLDQGLGDVFVVRVAGNVCDIDEIGSIEYGVGHLKTPLLVVLGHTKCGAVTAVCQKAEVHGSIPELVANIGPAVDAVRRRNASLEGDALVREAIRWNVFQSIEDLLTRSEEVRAIAASGDVRIVGAVYDLDSGKIEWLGPHPREDELLRQPTHGDSSGGGVQ